MSIDFSAWRKQVQADMESVLDRHLPPTSEQPAKLHGAMRYTTLDGGKRVRPLLDSRIGELFDAPRALAVLEKYVPEFVADPQAQKARSITLRMLHAFSSDTITAELLQRIDAELATL